MRAPILAAVAKLNQICLSISIQAETCDAIEGLKKSGKCQLLSCYSRGFFGLKGEKW